ISKNAMPGQYPISVAGLTGTLEVWKMVLPDKPTHPIYMELTGPAVLSGHKLDPNSDVPIEAALLNQYAAMARAHRIEPYKHRIEDPSVQADGTFDLDRWSEFGGSFRQTVLDSAIAPPMIAPHFTQQELTPAVTTAIGLLAAQYPGAWAYLIDEPNDAVSQADAIARATIFRTYAPNVPLMSTVEQTDALAPYIDIFCPHDLWFKQPGHPQTYRPGYWMYGSCMNHGACDSIGSGTLQGPPDLLIDLPMVHSRAYAWVNATLGAKASLYYSTVEGFLHFGVFRDAWVDQYIFFSNGDGTLFYPGRNGERGFTSDQPVASLRLKGIRQSSYDLEYIAMANANGIPFQNPVTDALTWSKSYDDYESVRLQLGAALNAALP
ncbi:MAG: DUF4091 domain-containing protein, partial [Bdellovibrionota bacterium]